MLRYLIPAALLLCGPSHAQQPPQDHSRQAVMDTVGELTMALIFMRADAMSCKADLAKLRQETTAKPETK